MANPLDPLDRYRGVTAAPRLADGGEAEGPLRRYGRRALEWLGAAAPMTPVSAFAEAVRPPATAEPMSRRSDSELREIMDREPLSVGNPNALQLGAGLATAGHFALRSKWPAPARALGIVGGAEWARRSGSRLWDDFNTMLDATDARAELRRRNEAERNWPGAYARGGRTRRYGAAGYADGGSPDPLEQYAAPGEPEHEGAFQRMIREARELKRRQSFEDYGVEQAQNAAKYYVDPPAHAVVTEPPIAFALGAMDAHPIPRLGFIGPMHRKAEQGEPAAQKATHEMMWTRMNNPIPYYAGMGLGLAGTVPMFGRLTVPWTAVVLGTDPGVQRAVREDWRRLTGGSNGR